MESQMVGSVSQNFFAVFSKISWNENSSAGVGLISRNAKCGSMTAQFSYLHSRVGVVHQDIQPSILLPFDLLKQFFDVFVVCRITDNWHAASAPLLYLW